MNRFSISQLAQFSGVKAHTIRMWEQRYNALQPERSEGNTRHYDGDQLRRLLNIVSLMNSSYKVSQLCSMNDKQLFDLLEERYKEAVGTSDTEYFVGQLIAAGINYDEYYFQKIFSHSLLKFGLEKTYRQVIYPMLYRIGLMWTCNSLPPAPEHFIINLLKQKLFTAIDSMPPESEDAKTWLLFLPEDEFHEIGLLFTSYYLKSRGMKVIYLGANVPMDSVRQCIEDTGAAYLLTFLVHKALPENIGQYISELVSAGKSAKIFIAADKELAEGIPATSPFNWLFSVDDLERELPNNNQSKHII